MDEVALQASKSSTAVSFSRCHMYADDTVLCVYVRGIPHNHLTTVVWLLILADLIATLLLVLLAA